MLISLAMVRDDLTGVRGMAYAEGRLHELFALP
jgi:hypothetical protein